MKTLILTLVALSNFAFAAQTCVDLNDAGWSENQYQALPDGSITMKDPFYSFNGTKYYVRPNSDSISGLCRAFGRKLVRSTYQSIYDANDAKNETIYPGLKIQLNRESGEISDTVASDYIIGSIQCK